jgi:putative tryptophan/tyrosine transport system substrate-binding protein
MKSFRVKRREFITLLGGAAATWPRVAGAQQPTVPVIGYLSGSTALSAPWTAAFAQRLHELGWVEGRTVAIDYRWAEGRREREAEIAAEFVRLKVDVIASHAAGAYAAKQATSVIPIVVLATHDPVGTGLVASLARPGGNVTGLSAQQADTAGKRLAMLREVVPGLRRVAILVNAADPGAVLDSREVLAAASALGLETVTSEIRQAQEIAPAFDALRGRVDAMYVCAETLVNTNRIRINTLALGARLPTMHGLREWVEVGGLMSYGANFPALYRRAAEFVDKILRGAKPSEIPVEQPTKFDLVINLTTAKALDLTVPQTLIAIADELIE